MNSGIFDAIGLGNMDIALLFIIFLVFIIALLVVVIILGNRIRKLSRKYERFMRGADAASLEEEMLELFEDMESLKVSTKQHNRQIEELYRKVRRCYQKTGIVKYDAFREMGGKLSFSIAMLDERNNGYILNSVHSTTGCYTYTKEIVGGKSYIDLGDEEMKALNQAISADPRKEKISEEQQLKQEQQQMKIQRQQQLEQEEQYREQEYQEQQLQQQYQYAEDYQQQYQYQNDQYGQNEAYFDEDFEYVNVQNSNNQYY
ncbi:MAG: DUF4446 family protein [Lachnospiraceae bacterium]|nr:DUF4446 family protein [Lachnospiraceae bacterium]